MRKDTDVLIGGAGSSIDTDFGGIDTGGRGIDGGGGITLADGWDF